PPTPGHPPRPPRARRRRTAPPGEARSSPDPPPRCAWPSSRARTARTSAVTISVPPLAWPDHRDRVCGVAHRGAVNCRLTSGDGPPHAGAHPLRRRPLPGVDGGDRACRPCAPPAPRARSAPAPPVRGRPAGGHRRRLPRVPPLFTDPATGRSLLVDPGSAPQVRSTATPDVVVAGAMRTASRLRYRAFYLGAARSLAVQQRHRDTPTPLVGGTRVQRTLAGRTPFVVPRVLDAGYYAAQRADWVVEEALDGAPVVREEAERTAEEVLSLDRKSTRLNSSHVKIAYAV